MKKFLKLVSLSLVAFVLVACGNDNSKDTAESSSTVESSVESTSEKESSSDTESNDSNTSESGEEESEDESVSRAESSDTNVVMEVFVSGEDEPIASFTVEPTEEMSVLDLMSAQEDFDFNFNEDLGTIDEIKGYENDYDAGTTWVYLLNGQLADYGVVTQTVKPGDRITWYYGTVDEIPVDIQHPEAADTEDEATDETEVDPEAEDVNHEEPEAVTSEDEEEIVE